MYGTNDVAPIGKIGDPLMIKSIFYTIQGEGPWAGLPAVFVRLAGCNLRCFFCDTDFDGPDVRSMWPEEIISEITEKWPFANYSPRVVLTGGEPMIQDAARLVDRLLRGHFASVQIETAGTVMISEEFWSHLFEHYPERLVLVCSPKTPKVHRLIQRYCKHFKYIIRYDEVAVDDGLPMQSTQMAGTPQIIYRPTSPDATIWVQPCDDGDERNERHWDETARVALTFNYRVSMQLHKLLELD